MGAQKCLLLLVLISLATGCSTYPLPQDVTGSTTQDIVESVRCEARQGLRETALDYLRSVRYATLPIWHHMKGKDLADALEKDPGMWLKIRIKDLDKKVRDDFAFYENSQIIYEFTLNIEESNIDTANIGFSRAFSTRKDALGLSAESTRKRSVSRTFNVVDTFSELALKVTDDYCLRPRSINIVYPIVGKLPIRDLISTYVYTNNFGNLAGSGKEPKNIFGTSTTPAIPQMGDTIIFTTKLAGVLNPTFALNPMGAGILLASAGFKTDDYREDKHQLDIVVSTSPDSAKADPLDARIPPPLPYDRQSLASATKPYYLPANKKGDLTNNRVNYALTTLAIQRQRNVDNAIIQIGSSLSQLAR